MNGFDLKACSKCKEEKPSSSFQLYKGHPIGQCRECKTAAMKQNRLAAGIAPKTFSIVEGDCKTCLLCAVKKYLNEFSPDKRGSGGVAAYCKPCTSEKYRNKEKAIKATTKYRQVHRERHLANHRIRMWERRTKLVAVTDGTATEEFLISLYNTEMCAYCKKHTSKEDRTADHIIPLNNGGIHGASNLTMACWSCNSSKHTKSAESFLQRISNGS